MCVLNTFKCINRKYKVVLRQVRVTDYRLGVFDALRCKLDHFYVVTGNESFAPMFRTVDVTPAWMIRRNSIFFLNRRLVWLASNLGPTNTCGILINEWNPRIISLWRDWLLCRLRGVKFILWGHAWGKGGPRGAMFRFRHWMARRADGVICYTESQAKLTREMNPGLPVIAAPNACLPRSACRVTGDESKRTAVIYVGRIVTGKKVGLLVEGFAQACRSGEAFDARLIIVGDGPERPGVERRAVELGISDRVTWLGHQADLEVLRGAYEQAFVSVSPGYVGLSLTQSFAFGVPALIAKNEPHSPEIEAAQDGVNARFFASDDPDDLATKLRSAWTEWRGIEHKRKELSAWTAETYSFEKMADRFIEMVGIVTARQMASRDLI